MELDQEADRRTSWFFPAGHRHQFVEYRLQSLKPAFVVSRCTLYPPLAAMQVQAIRRINLCDFVPQLRDALSNWNRHEDKLTE
jgi:hypothetical protein